MVEKILKSGIKYKMIITLILGLILGGISVIFITQNTTVITINFLSYQLESSLALVIIASILMGVLITLIFSIPTIIRDQIKYSALRKQNKNLEDSLHEAQSKVQTTETREAVINKHIADNS